MTAAVLVLGASSAGEVLQILDDAPTVDLVLVDLRLGKEDGLQGLEQIVARPPPIAHGRVGRGPASCLTQAWGEATPVKAVIRAQELGLLAGR